MLFATVLACTDCLGFYHYFAIRHVAKRPNPTV
jgi:hypothetical protein